MKTASIFFIYLLFSFNGFCQKNTIIKGQITADTTFEMVLLLRGFNPFPAADVLEVVDSAIIKNGKFKLKFKANEIDFYTLRIKNTYFYMPLVGKPGDKVNFKWEIKDKVSEYSSSNSIENEVYLNRMINQGKPLIYNLNRFSDSASFYRKKNDSLNIKYALAQNSYWFDSLQRLYIHLLKTYPNTYSSLFTMSRDYRDFDEDYVKEYLNRLPTYLQNTSLAKEIYYNKFVLPVDIKNIKSFADFQFTDSSLNKFDYSPFLGKIVLVDFWASWCKPCIENFPKLAHVLSSTNRKDFEVLGISLDDTNNSWLKGLRRLKPEWVNVIDSKAWKGLVVSYFNIKSIPRYILVGKNGEILNDKIEPDKIEMEVKKYLTK